MNRHLCRNRPSPLVDSHTVNFATVAALHTTHCKSMLCVVCLPSCVWLFATPWTATHEASLSLTISQNSYALHGWCVQPPHPLTCSSSALNFSQHQGLCQWVGCSHQVTVIQSFRFSISPSNEYSGLISLKIDWFDLLAVQGTVRSLLQHHSSKVFGTVFGTLPSLRSSSHNHTWSLGSPHPWLYGPLSADWYLCFSTHCLGLS